MKRLKISALFLSTVLILSLLLSACGGAAPMDKLYASGAVQESMPTVDGKFDMMTDQSVGGTLAPSPSTDSSTNDSIEFERKLIKTGNYELQTTAFGTSYKGIVALVENAGGYIQNSSLSGGSVEGDEYEGRHLNMTVRVPADALDDFAGALSAHATVIYQSVDVEEVTDYYYDTEARISSLKIQEKTLLDILEKAESLTDVIELQQALSNVRYEIESLEGTIRRLDSQISYSTVHMTMYEVRRVDDTTTPITLGGRISSRFKASLNEIGDTFSDLIVFFAGNILIFAIWAAIIAAIVIVIRLLIKRSKKRRALKKAASAPAPAPPTTPPAPPTDGGGDK